MKVYGIILLILVGTHLETKAQRSKMFALNFNSFGAVHNFRDNITKNPVGISFSFLWSTKNDKFQYGLEYGIAMYSSNEYEYELVNEGQPGTFIGIYEEDCPPNDIS